MNLALRLELDLLCFILAYSRSLLFIKRLISRVTQGWPSLGLQNLVGTYFSVIMFNVFLNSDHLVFVSEPRCEKTGLQGVRPGPTQTGLYSYRRWLEA